MIKTDICEPPVEVISDGKRLYRVIQNLMDNALKYSLAGTRIYYTLEKTPVKAVITIKNISAYEMDFTPAEIMERFSRGDKSRTTEGSGLGLSIVKTVLDKHNFRYGVNSEEGKGSEFYVLFPLL